MPRIVQVEQSAVVVQYLVLRLSPYCLDPKISDHSARDFTVIFHDTAGACFSFLHASPIVGSRSCW